MLGVADSPLVEVRILVLVWLRMKAKGGGKSFKLLKEDKDAYANIYCSLLAS